MGMRDEGTVAIEVDRLQHTGEWKSQNGTITVRYAMETETTRRAH